MKPIYESIVPSTNTSIKVESYEAKTTCGSAGWHIHPEYEIVYVKNGNGTLKIDNKAYDYTNGTLVFLAGNIPHSDFGNNERPNRQEVVVQFSRAFVNQKLALFPELKKIKGLIELSKYVLIFDSKTKSHLSKKFESFDQLKNQGKLINLLAILDYLSAKKNYVQLLNNSTLPEFREKETYRLKSIFEYVNNNYHGKIEVKDIAMTVGLTPNSFSRFFKKMTNKTFIDFLNEFRVRKAVDIMSQGDHTVNEVMYSAGFNSPSYFSKQFYKYQKIAPSIYLRKNESL